METEHKVVAIETRIPDEFMSGLLLVRVHTDSGLVGHGETYYAPHAVAAMIHDWMARRLMGASALAIEAHWQFLYERSRAFGTGGQSYGLFPPWIWLCGILWVRFAASRSGSSWVERYGTEFRFITVAPARCTEPNTVGGQRIRDGLDTEI